jgi:hypothetical protein
MTIDDANKFLLDEIKARKNLVSALKERLAHEELMIKTMESDYNKIVGGN